MTMRTFAEHIDKAEVNALPVVQPRGRIVVVTTARDARAAVACLRQQPVIGFDTETRPNFSPRSHYKVSLVQLATPDICFLFRLNFLGENEDLRRLLEDESVKKVGLSLKDDTHSLHAWMPVNPQGLIDIQTLAPQFGIAEKSLQKIYAIVFGKKISKAQQLSNWEALLLTPSQKNYAAIDAWSCLEIYNELQRTSAEL